MTSEYRIQALTLHHLDEMHSLELAVWPQPLAASREKLAHRLDLNHTLLGLWSENLLVGMASYRLGWLDLHSKESFPQDFISFSGNSNQAPFNAAFAYNLGIHSAYRGRQMTTALVEAVLNSARQAGCNYVVGDGRCPSYNGSVEENIPPRPAFKQALDDIISKGKAASKDDYLLDPVLNFYHHLLDCQFLWAIPAFIPADDASGGHRVIFCKSLS